MSRNEPTHRCTSCGVPAQRWVGRCPGCGGWNTLVAVEPVRSGRTEGVAPVALVSVDPGASRPSPTGVGEVDRVLGGGLVGGSVTLVFGEPGVGKSTLLLQVLCSSAATGPVLLVSAEESAAQVRARADRLGPLPSSVLVAATTDLGEAAAAMAASGARLVVVDSIQTMADPEGSSTAGSLSQVRAVVDTFGGLARSLGAAVVLVGHVTKDGDLAGPRALEHLVDTVVSFEGDRHHALRLLRAVKHRFGATGEVGLFEMGERGLVDVADPGPLLLADRRAEVAGSALVPLLQGRRPLVVELQALVVGGNPGSPRRSAQGVDGARLAALVAVLECRAQVPLGPLDLFVSATGGIRATEPAADLPLTLAVASAAAGQPLPEDLVSFGEIGLAGEVRQVPGVERRLAEAARLGLRRAVVPMSTPDGPPSLVLHRVRALDEAIDVVLRRSHAASPGAADAHPAATIQRWSTMAASR